MKHANFNDIIDDLRRRTKAGELPREVRIAEIDRVTEDLFAKTGKFPDAKQLEQLSDLILYEELTDPHPDKVTREEYPFFSDEQLARRQEGKHVKNNDKTTRIEVPLEIASEVGTDNRNYKFPKRRKRSDRENTNVENRAASNNRERTQKHKAFVNGKDGIEVTSGKGVKERKPIEFIKKNVKIK
jgi:hypothetical protein